jgi:bacterioferritin-associated ferredoxin
MEPNDELCLCFHVTRRKVENYIRIERPQRVGQLAECYGAGTGCGWCRPFLQRLFDAAQGQTTYGATANDADALPTSAEYAQGRTRYVREGGGTPPPGATPVGDESGA